MKTLPLPKLSRDIIAIITLSVLLAAFLLLWSLPGTPRDESGAAKPTHALRVYHPTYDNLSQLAADADYIIIGQVVDNGTFRQVARTPVDAPNYPDEFKHLPYTDYRVRVSRVAKGAVSEKSIILSRLGGESETTRYALEHEVPITRGHEYVIFATKDGQHNRYFALAGATAIAELQDGRFRLPQFTGRVHTKALKTEQLGS